ncbi:hypothetical protein [Cognatilysobacter lacus]|uniref:DUF2007 domain-containing protein n=1 Tax=Cognatilysobacter lacus TaxID=1643323 RepID=A0A5D8Z322_9GAMM|nr:hypothetical protein [Lysobacter lacus]TZF88502.1 hypothetical protein FW784_09750 [Lysobacter lacus]
MRQVFSSARLENVERVAQLLRDEGIEVRITDGRSYKGNRRTTTSYRDRDAVQPAVWVVQSNDQARAREILRAAGLFESTRPGAGAKLTFTSDYGDESTRTPAQKRAMRIKLALLMGIVVVIVFEFIHLGRQPVAVPPPQAAEPARGPFDGRVSATPPALAVAVLQKELGEIDMPVACLAVDRRDAPLRVRAGLRTPPSLTVVAASDCQRIPDEERGSVHRGSGRKAMMVDLENFRASSPDAGSIEYTAYHHRMWAKYKTLEVKRIGGQWRVTRALKVVSP